MIHDIDCPYCGAGQEINHDDGYGYEEDRTHRQECPECNKMFGFTTSSSYYYEVDKMPCANDEQHSLKPITRYKARCEWCDEEFTIDKKASEKAIKEYWEEIENERRRQEMA